MKLKTLNKEVSVETVLIIVSILLVGSIIAESTLKSIALFLAASLITYRGIIKHKGDEQ